MTRNISREYYFVYREVDNEIDYLGKGNHWVVSTHDIRIFSNGIAAQSVASAIGGNVGVYRQTLVIEK